MPHTINIDEIEVDPVGRIMVYYTEVGLPGERHCHGFPPETLEWRVAEYGFDPADKATLIRVILAERWEESGQEAFEEVLDTDNTRARTAKLARQNARSGLTITPGPKWNELVDRVPAPVAERIEQKRAHIEWMRQRARAPLRGSAPEQKGRPVLS